MQYSAFLAPVISHRRVKHQRQREHAKKHKHAESLEKKVEVEGDRNRAAKLMEPLQWHADRREALDAHAEACRIEKERRYGGRSRLIDDRAFLCSGA